LRLEAAQIGEIGHIRVCEVEGALDVTVDAFSDSRQIQVVPGCEVVAAAIVTVGGAGVWRSKRVGNGIWDVGLEHVDIAVRAVWPEITSCKESVELVSQDFRSKVGNYLPCRVDDSRCIGVLICEDGERSILGIKVRVSPSVRDSHIIELFVSSYGDICNLNSWVAKYRLPWWDKAVVTCGSELSSLDLFRSAKVW
jgi:hypothetical protein